MKLKEFIENLNNLIKEYPETLEMQAVYSIDEEGNGYKSIFYEPSIHQFEDINKWNLEEVGSYEDGDDSINLKDCNAVCIN